MWKVGDSVKLKENLHTEHGKRMDIASLVGSPRIPGICVEQFHFLPQVTKVAEVFIVTAVCCHKCKEMEPTSY